MSQELTNMAYLYATRTIQLPAHAVGCLVKDRNLETVATAEDSFKAEALAMLVNAGQGVVETQDAAYEERMSNLSKSLFRAQQDLRNA